MTEQVIEFSKLEGVFKEHNQKLDATIAEAKKEMAERTDGLRTETAGKIEAMVAEGKEIADRLQALEQKNAAKAEESKDRADFAKRFIESDSFKAYSDGQSQGARFEMKTAITNVYPATTSQPLVQGDRQSEIYKNPDRILRISSLLPHMPTSSNLVEFAKENVFTNNAAPQYGTESPTQIENVSKAESAATFTLSTAAVVTIAHSIPASRQVLGDSPMLEGYLRGRMMYGLALEVENELLTGDGTSGKLSGLLNQATAVASSVSGTANKLDVIRQCVTKLQQSEFMDGAAIVLNPADWESIETLKVNAGTDDRYIVGDARSALQPTLWGLPVVLTNSMTAGQVLVGTFGQCGAVFDREQMSLRISDQHSDNFTKNMVTMLAECRLALAIWRPSALRKATF